MRKQPARAAEEIGCAFWTDDVNALLARPDIDVVDVTVPNVAHEAIVTAAAQAGKHIYCEKPLAMNVAEAKRMVAAVEAAGVKSQMTFNFRFFPAIQHAPRADRRWLPGPRLFLSRALLSLQLHQSPEADLLATAARGCRRRHALRPGLAHSRPALLLAG